MSAWGAGYRAGRQEVLDAIAKGSPAEQLLRAATEWDEHTVADQVTRLAYASPGFESTGHTFGERHAVVLRRGGELWEVTATARRLDEANADARCCSRWPLCEGGERSVVSDTEEARRG